MKPKKNKIILALMCTALCISFLSSCAGSQPSQPQQSQQETSSSAAKEPIEKDQPEGDKSTAQQDASSEEVSLPDTLPIEFTFASGAGGWRTVLTLNPDGSFEGSYSDSDMGDSGDGYPNGTVYVCEFSGQFDDIKQVDDHTYSMTLGEVTTSKEKDEDWIEGRIRYIASDPYGLEDGKEFLLYTPETPIEGLSEEFLSWWPNRYTQSGEQPLETLSCYGIYNQKMGYGFFTSE